MRGGGEQSLGMEGGRRQVEVGLGLVLLMRRVERGEQRALIRAVNVSSVSILIRGTLDTRNVYLNVVPLLMFRFPFARRGIRIEHHWSWPHIRSFGIGGESRWTVSACPNTSIECFFHMSPESAAQNEGTQDNS